jgi:S-adenosylmethionine-diacylglycerol 3-amino-3-carboxypropyl transferase
MRLQKFEFESRIFISFGIVGIVCGLSFVLFPGTPANGSLILARAGFSERAAETGGFINAAVLMAAASVLRIWSGSVLTSKRMMAFKVQVDSLLIVGPYLLVRNPIYLADLIAFCGFALCLPPSGLIMPTCIYLHYLQLIRYEEVSLVAQFGEEFREYMRRVPRLIPDLRSLHHLSAAFRGFTLTRDGFRHNALFVLFMPGFILAALKQNLLWAVAVGLPAVVDWAIVHTKIGITPALAGGKSASKESGDGPLRQKKVFRDILYARCWEDPEIDRRALSITPGDVVFSITSGGCNTLTFLLDNPRKVIALDLNPHQNYLLALKIAAFNKLSYAEMLEFLGARESSHRRALYQKLRGELGQESLAYWDSQPRKIARGILHCGRYEGYMRLLRFFVVKPLLSPRLIEKFYNARDTSEREKLFAAKLENWRWWFLTRVMLSRPLNSFLFDKSFFAYLDNNFSFGRYFAAKARQALTRLPLKENYFLSSILRGRFSGEDGLPPYLRRANFEIIRSRLKRIEIVTDSCDHYFSTLPEGTISKFNFTNIFEWMSPGSFKNLLRETVRVAGEGAIMTYRNLLVFREHPPCLDSQIRSLMPLARELHAQDLSFIYNNYVVEEIHKRSDS